MEGLDLFVPVVAHSDSSSSDDENDSGAEFDGSGISLDQSDTSYKPRSKRYVYWQGAQRCLVVGGRGLSQFTVILKSI